MRNLHLEASIWYLFTSVEFFEAAARECEGIVGRYSSPTKDEPPITFGIYLEDIEKFKKRAEDFKRGAAFARMGDYEFLYDIAGSIGGDVRNMIEKAPHGWMDLAASPEFNGGTVSRLQDYAHLIEAALCNALSGAETYFNPNPDCPERSDDDDGFHGDTIIDWYNDFVDSNKKSFCPILPDPLPEYTVDTSITCRTGHEVPWTGVWYPSTGLERHSLTFAIKGMMMQPVYRVVKSIKELRTEDQMFPQPETLAVETTWHPVKPPA